MLQAIVDVAVDLYLNALEHPIGQIVHALRYPLTLIAAVCWVIVRKNL
jgi:hypothetical protein